MASIDVEEYCAEHNLTEPQLVDGRWFAFPPGGVMPVEVPRQVLCPPVTLSSLLRFIECVQRDFLREQEQKRSRAIFDVFSFRDEVTRVAHPCDYSVLEIDECCYPGDPFPAGDWRDLPYYWRLPKDSPVLFIQDLPESLPSNDTFDCLEFMLCPLSVKLRGHEHFWRRVR